MLYIIIKDPIMGNYLEISHGNQKVDFDISSLLSKNNNTDAMFISVNGYLATLDLYTQTELFDVLSEFYIYKNKNVDYSKIEVSRHLETVINKVCSIASLDKIKPWLIWNQNNIVLPSNLSDEFVYDPDMNVTENKTYVKAQYLNLIAVLQVVKILSPILGEYNNYIKMVAKQNLHKTFLLCLNTNIFESEEMEKLRIYINEIQNTTKTQGSNKNEQYIINKGLCSDDINDNILAEIFLNKLYNADLYNPKSNIISIIFQTIKIKSNPAVAETEIIRSKREIGNTGEDVSYFEDYRKTTDIPVGTIAEIQYSLGELDKIITELKIEKYFSKEFYHDELNYSKEMAEVIIDETQIYLLGWFLGKYIDPRGLFYIEAKKIIELLTLARVVSWNKGHKFISLLLTATRSLGGSGIISIGSKTILSKDIQDRLNAKYTFFYDLENRNNYIENSIIALYNNITGNVWETNANMYHVLEHNNDNRKGNRKLNIPLNLTDQLALYILD